MREAFNHKYIVTSSYSSCNLGGYNRPPPSPISYRNNYLKLEAANAAETLAVLTIDGHLFAQDIIMSYFWMPAVDITQAASLRRYTFTLPSTETSSSASKEGALYAIHSDHLGTPQVITNSQQQVVWQAQYQAFGEAKLTTASITNPLRFPGQYYDEESGLHYNWHRYYNPQTGRYITSDPIGLAGGVNTYGYANLNPLVYSDPDGRLALNLMTGIIGGLAGGFGNVLGQLSSLDDFECFSVNEFFVATGVGFVAGAIAPLTLVSSISVAGAANVMQYGITEVFVNGKELDDLTSGGIASSLITGFAGGAIAGPIVKNVLPSSTTGRFFPKSLGKTINRDDDMVGNITASNALRSFGAAIEASLVDVSNEFSH